MVMLKSIRNIGLPQPPASASVLMMSVELGSSAAVETSW
jgi:hypothetical protein